MKFLATQEEGWPAHAYRTNKILLGLKDRWQREKKAETEKFNSIKRNVLRCWAWSQNQSILQHGSPAHLEAVRNGILSTKQCLEKEQTSFWRRFAFKVQKSTGVKNQNYRSSEISQKLFPRVMTAWFPTHLPRAQLVLNKPSSPNVIVSVAVSYYPENGICTTFMEALSLHKC